VTSSTQPSVAVLHTGGVSMGVATLDALPPMVKTAMMMPLDVLNVANA